MSFTTLRLRRTGAVAQYGLGLGSIFTILSLPPAIFLMLGYQANPGLAFVSVVILVAGIGAVGARNRLEVLLDRIRPLRITPRITNPYYQAIVLAFTLVAVNLSSRLVIPAQIASISQFGSVNDLATLFQTSIMETLLVQYFLFYLFFAFLIYITRSYWVAGLVAVPSSAFWAYIFHFYVYSTVAPVWNWVILAFTILSTGYWLTGNILVPMIPHILVDTLGIILQILFPGLCPGFGGLC